jgi:kynureninase
VKHERFLLIRYRGIHSENGHEVNQILKYAFASQVRSHGLDPKSTIIEVQPRPGEYALRESDILDIIREQGQQIALVLFSGVQYYTGQWFPMQKVTTAGKERVCTPLDERTPFWVVTSNPGF